MDAILHHVSIITTDLQRALTFYRDVLGLKVIDRPPFDIGGVWLASGTSQVHLVVNPGGTFRGNTRIDNNDVHFALRVVDFEAALRELARGGYREDAETNDPKRVVVKRTGLAGFPQAYLIDPDRHVVEINAAA